ncbi:hypothetical protein A8A01_03015 [Ewingella americana]|nr:hypothetical protein A8A01_03015 [Ewingella americana]
MTLEQRVDVLEKEIAELKIQLKDIANSLRCTNQSTSADIATVNNIIQNAIKNGAGKKSAEWGVKINPADGSLSRPN